MRTFRLIAFIFLVFPLQVQAQRIIEINDSLNEFIFSGEYFMILEDKNHTLTIEDITTPEYQSKFILNKSEYAYNENINSAYWIKFKVKNNSKGDKNFILESYSPHTNDWRLFISKGDKFKVKKSGTDINFYQREYINKNLIFNLPLDTSGVNTFYIKVYSRNFSSFDFRIKPLDYFTFYNTNEYYFLGLYYGILLLMAIYNLLIFFTTREKVYIYYILYVFSGMLTTLADDSLGYQFVWFKYPELNSVVANYLAPVTLLITFVLYSREFLQLKNNFPKYDKVVIAGTLFYLFYYLLRITILPEALFFRGLYVVPFVLTFIIALKCFFSGYKPARFFIAGYTIILISIIIIKLRSNGSIEGNLFTVYSLNYGLVLEVIVLSFALADRIKYEKKEREKALKEKSEAQEKIILQLRINEELKDKVNKELEARVAERTDQLNQKNRDLEEMNIKLQEMTNKANEMALKVDLDNWNLNKKVKESIKDRMSGLEVSYDEFQKIFPDETACFRYLYDLKWGNLFQCKKCGSAEYNDHIKGFARKCAICDYYESVTANTLYHALKFPINKAFYITYLTIQKKDKFTLDEMAELIKLQRNTCWKFRKKIQEAAEAYQKNNRKPVKSWEEIILTGK
ncbi:MAG: hypothetical protein K2X86_06825 [Cytophagaceae bacterium]|nr:hypothetical protein [Cytophagaceae bacterium]